MNVDSILISEYAGLAGDGGLSIFKTFNLITTSQTPARVAMLCVSVLIHAHRSEGGSGHLLEVRLIDQDRKVVKVLDRREVTLTSEQPPPGMPIRHHHIVGQINLEFPRPGPYAIEVHIDGTYAAAAPLYVELRR